MNKKEKLFMLAILFGIAAFTFLDILTDLKEGVTWWHVSIEAVVIILAGVGALFLIRDIFLLKHRLADEIEISKNLVKQNKLYKEESKKYIEGLSHTIDKQLDKWQLTKSEKEVAFLLLKGFSLKEIALLRSTTEKTARTHSTSIYHKAQLANRSQLSAFFLEDLLSPRQ